MNGLNKTSEPCSIWRELPICQAGDENKFPASLADNGLLRRVPLLKKVWEFNSKTESNR